MTKNPVIKDVVVTMFIMYTLPALHDATEDACFITGKDIVVYDNYRLNSTQMVNSQFEKYGSNILEMNKSIMFDLISENHFTLYGLSPSEEDSWTHDFNSTSSHEVHHHFSVFSNAGKTTIFHNCELVSVHQFPTNRVFVSDNNGVIKRDPVHAFALDENRELRIKLKPSKIIKLSFYISSKGNCKMKIYSNKQERSSQQFIGSIKLSAEEGMKDKGYVMWKKMEGSFGNADGEVLIITNEDSKNGKCFITNIELRNEMDNYITDEDVEMASIFNITTEYFEKEPRTSLPTDIPDSDNNIKQKNQVKKSKNNTRAATEKYRQDSSSAESNETAIAIGVSVGIVVFAILAIAVTIQFVKKKRNNAHNNNSNVDPSDEQQRLSNECNGIESGINNNQYHVTKSR